MNFDQICEHFTLWILPHIIESEKMAGFPDVPGRREAFNNMVDALAKNGDISEELAQKIAIPDDLEEMSYNKAFEKYTNVISCAKSHLSIFQ